VFAGWACCSSDDVYTEDLPRTPFWDETGTGMEMTDALVFRVNASGDFDGVMLDIVTPQEWEMKYWFNSSKEKEEADPYRPDSLEKIITGTSIAADELDIPIYIGEFDISPIRPPFGLGGNKAVIESNTERADYYRKCLDIVMPRYDGVIHLGFLEDNWLTSVFGIDNTLTKQVIKEKYGEYTHNK
jgi:hypothetical protein